VPQRVLPLTPSLPLDKNGPGEIAAAALAAAGWRAAALAAGPTSSSMISVPSDTLSPILSFSSFTTPAAGDGISIVALSDSTVMSEVSFSTASPALTSTSMTSISLKSPMSGTLISTVSFMRFPASV
jgi:hypothetical protein